MKKKKLITALALTMAVGMGATVYAASSDVTTASVQRLGLGRITAMRGYDYISNILKNKLGLSDAEITKATNSGETLYSLAMEKGLTQDELKASLLEERTKAIETAVSKGTITKEEGETLKANLTANMENCTGNFGQAQGLGQGRGQGRGMAGNGQGRCNLSVSTNINTK
jgi:hypothetical protein